MERINNIIKNLKQKNKKNIQKLLLVLIATNLIISVIFIFTDLFLINKIIKTIINSLVGIVNIILVILMLKKDDEQISEKEVELKEDKTYNPIMLQFFKQSKVTANINLILAECESLIERDLLKINKKENETIMTLKSDVFTRMNGIEGIEENQIDSYSKNGIPAYENLFVTKVLFPFENEITLRELIKKAKNGYYKERGEMCEFLLEKMVVHELNNQNIMQESKNKTFAIILIINIICSVLTWFGLGIINILLFIGAVANIAVSVILLKNENVFAYSFSPEILEYIDKVTKYAKNIDLDSEDITKKDIILKMLFGDIIIDETIEKYL